MTVLKTWSEVLEIYKESRPKIFRALFLAGGIRQTWPTWSATIALVLLLLAHTLQPEAPGRTLATFFGSILAFLALILARERCCAKFFDLHYQHHSLGNQSLFKRERNLRYALFKDILQERGYTAAKVQRLSHIADIVGCPDKPYPASQNIIIIMLFTALIAISTDLLQLTETWVKNKGALFLLPLALGLYITYAIVDIIRSLKYRDLLIKRYLDRAYIDIQIEEQSHEKTNISTQQIII
ncbi:hypothetical protein KXR94_06405 [Stutzerimonas stutzeri]